MSRLSTISIAGWWNAVGDGLTAIAFISSSRSILFFLSFLERKVEQLKLSGLKSATVTWAHKTSRVLYLIVWNTSLTWVGLFVASNNRDWDKDFCLGKHCLVSLWAIISSLKKKAVYLWNETRSAQDKRLKTKTAVSRKCSRFCNNKTVFFF